MSQYIHFNWRGHSYAACCGTSIRPVIQTGAQMECPRATVFLCLDNDRAGNMACERMAEEFKESGIKTVSSPPTSRAERIVRSLHTAQTISPYGKVWNCWSLNVGANRRQRSSASMSPGSQRASRSQRSWPSMERLGYTDADNWRALVNSCAADIANGYKIPLEHLRRYAALHEKEKHGHIHMVVFSSDPKEGYLTG